MKRTIGGDRIGSGSKMQVDLHGYGRSTHDLSRTWKSTMASGTLVPFLHLVILPGDTIDIDLNAIAMTHPTIGPLLGSYKLQLDIYEYPVRLCQAQLHNNKLGIGLKMSDVKLPLMELTAIPVPVGAGAGTTPLYDLDNAQINPSCIHAYLGIRGIGQTVSDEENSIRQFNAVKLIGYWEIVKNYYANKQEEVGAVIHTEREPIVATVTAINLTNGPTTQVIPQVPAEDEAQTLSMSKIAITFAGTRPILSQILINTDAGLLSVEELTTTIQSESLTVIIANFDYAKYGSITLVNWKYQEAVDSPMLPPAIVEFPLVNIDNVRENILAAATNGAVPVILNTIAGAPYSYVLEQGDGLTNMGNPQEGLAIKTYQSDIFNNWMNTEWIDGPDGITEITAVDVSTGSFTIDALTLARKVYDMLNRIAISGGTYQDWQEAVYDHKGFFAAETPIYHGGLIKEIIFQEITSNAQAGNDSGTQPLGTLAGKGTLSKKHKGGKVTIKVNEIGWIIGIVSITPRIEYSQGNSWDSHLLTMDDFHKPGLDGIGFEEDIVERRAWWDTREVSPGVWIQNSAGKQPAWLNYMTAYNETFGNFAIGSATKVGEKFMTLNRNYEAEQGPGDKWRIKDLTTYIDPVKYNHIFAQTSLDAQNFWIQIATDITARRKMSGKLMPNL